MALVLGVTGSIATGKSLLCQHLVEQHGAAHGDADRIVHRMYDPGKPGFERIVAEFGDGVVGDDGYIDRKKLGAEVFGNEERMRALTTAIGDIGAEMHAVIEEWRAELPHDQVAILEAVNLIEAGYSAWCDATWLVGSDYAVALPRLMERNQFSEEEARQRLDAARDWTLRAPASDRVFLNNGALDDFLAEADAALRESLEQFRAGTLPPTNYFAWREAQDAERELEEAQQQPPQGQ